MDSFSNPGSQQLPPFQQPMFLGGPNEEEAGFDFWGVLSRRKWLVFLGVITGMAIGAVFHVKSDEIYESQLKVKIEPKSPFLLPVGTVGGEILPNFEGVQVRHDQFIKQEVVVQKMFERTPKLINLKSMVDLSDEERVEEILNSLEVAQNREEQTLYEVSYRNPVESDSQIILSNLISTYKESLREQYEIDKNTTLDQLRDFDRKYQNEFKVESGKLADLQQQMVSQFVITGQDQMQSARLIGKLLDELGQIRDTRAALSEDRNRVVDTLEIENEFSRQERIKLVAYQLRSEGKLRVDDRRQSNALIDQLQTAVSIAEEELFVVSARIGAGSPLVIAAQERVSRAEARLQEALDEQENNFLARPVNDEEALRSYLEVINGQIAALDRDTVNKNASYRLHVEENRKWLSLQGEINRQAERVEDVKKYLDTIRDKLVEVSPSSEASARPDEGFTVRLQQEASKGSVVWPILPLLLGIGGLLGAMSGFGLGCLVELADKTFHNPDEIMKQLNIPLIGHIPVIGQGKRYLVEGSAIEPVVCCYHRPKSQTSEAFRAVRTALYFNTQGKEHSVIQVTSPTPGDGKSTLAGNLAVSIAQSGKRVLLVDADMRRPRQHSTFGMEANEGFATVLSGRSVWRDCMYECEEIEGLTLMPCGKKPQNPAELCSSPQVKVLIEELREEFDFVIIDTPPLLAVTDACPIAARVDGVILTIRIKKNVRVSAERATDMLKNLGANCLGLVVNGVGAQSGYGSQYTYGAYRAGYSYNGYGEGYGYGYGYGGGKYYEEDQQGRKVAPRIESESHQEI